LETWLDTPRTGQRPKAMTNTGFCSKKPLVNSSY